jgi:hypothetical protein
LVLGANRDGSDDVARSITSQSTRGFIGEEKLTVAALAHLNGRVYDPPAGATWRYAAMVDEKIRLTFYQFENGQLPRLNQLTR